MSNVHRLRELLGIEADRAEVRQQADRVAQVDQRTPDVAEVLPDAFRTLHNDDNMADAMRQPVGRALKETVTENPNDLAEILFPVMGPAIRRAISEALRSALEGLNQSLAGGFSARNFKWRLEAWRTGVPFREVVLRHTLTYQLIEALLINKENGLLIARAVLDQPDGTPQVEQGQGMDRDAVAAMLTAVQDFVADSTGDADGELSSAELGGKVLWVLTGPHARLALVLSGQPPLSLRISLRDRLATMHQAHGAYINGYSGHQEPPAPLVSKMQDLLKESQDSAVQDGGHGAGASPKAALGLLIVLLLGLLAGGVWWGWKQHQSNQRWANLEALINSRPGVMWVNARRDVEPAVLNVLMDPLADDLTNLLSQAGFGSNDIAFAPTPFMSAEPEMMLRRLRQALSPIPADVAFSIVDGTIKISGSADLTWHRKLATHLQFAQPDLNVDTRELVTLTEPSVTEPSTNEQP